MIKLSAFHEKDFVSHFMNMKKLLVPYCGATCLSKIRLECISAHASLLGYFKTLQPSDTRNTRKRIFLMTCYMCHYNASGSAFQYRITAISVNFCQKVWLYLLLLPLRTSNKYKRNVTLSRQTLSVDHDLSSRTSKKYRAPARYAVSQ